MSSPPISNKLVDEPITIHCIFILSWINSCLNQKCSTWLNVFNAELSAKRWWRNKCTTHTAPSYLCDCLQLYTPSRALRSASDTLRLQISSTASCVELVLSASIFPPRLQWNWSPSAILSFLVYLSGIKLTTSLLCCKLSTGSQSHKEFSTW